MSKMKLRVPNRVYLAIANINKTREMVFIKDYTGEKLRQ